MVTGINTSGISVGSGGKVSVSGLTSSIDWKSIVDAQIKASRIPAVKLESKIAANTSKIAAYADLKAKTLAVTTAMDKLRGAAGLTATDVFKAKTASGTVEAIPTAPSGFVPSDIGALVTASVSQTAAAGTHTITIQQVAKANQVRTDVQTSNNVALGLTGSFSLNGKTITVSSSDTLLDLRSKINSAGAGVGASIVSASGSQHYLVLTSEKTGTDAAMDFAGGNALTDTLGLTTGGAVKNELVQAQNAIIDVNGITGIERQSNEINDVIEGVTLQVLKGEPNTVINLKVEPDLNTVKTAIVDLVEAYNELRAFAKEQRTASDRNEDGTVGDSEFGPLAFDTTMRSILTQLGNFATGSVDTNTDGFRSLSQIGVSVNADYDLEIDDTVLDSRLITNVDEIKNLFSFTSSTSDSRATILSRTASTAAGTYYVNIGGTGAGGEVLSANIKNAAGEDIAGLDDGSITIDGSTLTVVSGPATGLKIYFNGGANMSPLADVEVTVSRGLADQAYDFFNDTTRATAGTLDSLSTQLTTENDDHNKRIDTIDARLEIQRATLEAKFIAMEAALAQMENLKKTLSSYFDASASDS